MSHITKVDIEVKDLEALKGACKKLGLEFREGQKKFKWYSGQNDCDHAIGVAGSGGYEIGVVANGDGSYSLEFDAWDGTLTPLAGEGCVNLKQEYAVGVAKAEAKRIANQYGMSMVEGFDEHTGEAVITLRGYDD